MNIINVNFIHDHVIIWLADDPVVLGFTSI